MGFWFSFILPLYISLDQRPTQPMLLNWHEIQTWFFCSIQEHDLLYLHKMRKPKLNVYFKCLFLYLKSYFHASPSLPPSTLPLSLSLTHTHTQWEEQRLLYTISFKTKADAKEW